FMSDRSGLDGSGRRVEEQEIFDEVFGMIARAERLVLVDMFLFNDFIGAGPPPHRRLSAELTEALIARKRAMPGLRALLITDPVNTVYGGMESPHLRRLEAAGVEVVVTRLEPLRDSNPAWSGFWRLAVRPWGNRAGGCLANPFGPGRVTLRSWLSLLNFKANHRKVVAADASGRLRALVTSANPHDGSSAHSNVGIVFEGLAAQAVLETEQAVLDLSGYGGAPLCNEFVDAAAHVGGAADAEGLRIQVLTEGAIARAAEEMIGGAGRGDRLDLVMFYLADRGIVRALKSAAFRGAALRVTLDPNKDAFGRQKSGMPNRQAARELVAAGAAVRWAVTSGEQMHSKLLLVSKKDGSADLLLGSANFTRRNLRDYNLETNVRLSGKPDTPALRAAADYADSVWNNTGRVYTVGYDKYRDDSRWRVLRYRLQEATGLCTW
ncbi:MAG: phospholipase D-like domain-containing protein, partial [Kiritimatiellae bacterium]|nr:phospholipase D-like domain-containing protein [Kiritimatiellia bacterium]